jgi:hypothetical protein
VKESTSERINPLNRHGPMSKTTKQITVKIINDDDQDGPREWDNLGTMVCWHRNYKLGDEQPSQDPEEYRDDLPQGTIMLPLYLLDHSGISISTSGFNDPWDSGQVGFIYITLERIRKEYGDITQASIEKARQCLVGEVKTYDCFIRGNVWGFQVLEAEVCECCDRAGDSEVIDSCWGFYDQDEKGFAALDHIREHVAEEHHHLLEQAWEDRSYS